MLQLEKDIRTRLEVMLKQKNQRMQDLKGLQDQERDLCDVLCTGAYIIDPACVPTLEQLEAFRQHIASLVAEKVLPCSRLRPFVLNRPFFKKRI